MNDWLHLKEQELIRLDLLLHREILRLRRRSRRQSVEQR